MKKPQHAGAHHQRVHTVGKVVKPAKPHTAMSGGAAMHSTGGKGTATHKHGSQSAKHQAKKPRKWSPDEDYALCSLRAFAAALKLALDVDVPDAELTDAYTQVTDSPDSGMSILAAYSVLFRRGLAGHRPLLQPRRSVRPGEITIIGISEPQSHAVTVAPDGRWWSWGEPYDPWTSDIEEAWAVSWR